MRRSVLIVIALLFSGVAFAQQTPVEKARRVVDLLLQEKYPEVVAMFNAEMKAGLPTERLSGNVHALLGKVGAVRRRLEPQVQASGDDQVVVLPVEFEQVTMNFIVTVNKAGEIAGLWMRQAQAPAAAAPQATPAAAAPSPAITRANQTVDLLLQEKYADVITMFAPAVKSLVTEEKLNAGLKPYVRSQGAVRKRGQPKADAAGDDVQVILPVEFEKGTLEFIVSVNKAGELTGLFARPAAGGSVPWNPPAYSKPASFRTEEVTVGKGQWQLPGTLALPSAKGKVAALVLVHGSGPNDRDETIGPQKPFRDLAEGLASRGIAVLRYEKRTRQWPGKTAALRNFTVQDETVDDALAAAELLRSRPEIDPARVFVLGHSLGGYLITRIGRRDPKLAGLIALAGATRPFEDMVVEQNIYAASLQGNTPEALKQVEKVKAEAQRVKALTPESKVEPGDLPFRAPLSYWLDIKGYDPALEARSLKQPMLILQGERDYQVTMTDFARWKEALKDRKDVKLHSYPALNHLFEAGEGKSAPGEYFSKPSHVAPEVIDEIATWIESLTH